MFLEIKAIFFFNLQDIKNVFVCLLRGGGLWYVVVAYLPIAIVLSPILGLSSPTAGYFSISLNPANILCY